MCPDIRGANHLSERGASLLQGARNDLKASPRLCSGISDAYSAPI